MLFSSESGSNTFFCRFLILILINVRLWVLEGWCPSKFLYLFVVFLCYAFIPAEVILLIVALST